MDYEKPVVVDYGSLAELVSTFGLDESEPDAISAEQVPGAATGAA